MTRAPRVGDTLGRYEVLEEIGKGGMAAVYLARDPALGREVALKVMHPHLWGEAEYAVRFTREAKAVAALHHNNIMEVYDIGEEEDGPGYIVSEYLRGVTLREFIDQHGPPLPEVAAMVTQVIARALSCAHNAGIIHRDIKPENVIITERGRVVLTDFGIARITEGEAVTQTGAMIGSPAYMSPEQAKGRSVDDRSDLFSLGVVLYLLSTGRLPFSGRDPLSVVLSILEGEYEPALKINARIGGELHRIIVRLLQVDADERFQSAVELVSALDEFVGHAGITDTDDELVAYFKNPGAFNEWLVPQVIDTSLRRAQEATTRRSFAQALHLCERVLAFDEQNNAALQLLDRLASREGWHRLALIGSAVALLAAVGGGGLFWLLSSDPAPTSPPRAPSEWARDLSLGRPDATIRRAPPDARAPAIDRGADLAASHDARAPRNTSQLQVRSRAHRGRRGATRSSIPDASLASLTPKDAAVRPDTRPRAPRESSGRLRVQWGPFCDLYLDGKFLARSPMPGPIRVAPGDHVIRCINGPNGATREKRIRVAAGEEIRLEGALVRRIKVRLLLSRHDAVKINGKVYSRDFAIRPSRHRVELIRGGKLVRGSGDWITFPPRSCELKDEPSLGCR